MYAKNFSIKTEMPELPCLKIRRIAREVFQSPEKAVQLAEDITKVIERAEVDLNRLDLIYAEIAKVTDIVTAEFAVSLLIESENNTTELKESLETFLCIKETCLRVKEELQLDNIEDWTNNKDIFPIIQIILLTIEAANARPLVIKGQDGKFVPPPKYDKDPNGIVSLKKYLRQVQIGNWPDNYILGNCKPLAMIAYFILSDFGFEPELYMIRTEFLETVTDASGNITYAETGKPLQELKEGTHAYISINGRNIELTYNGKEERYIERNVIQGSYFSLRVTPFAAAADTRVLELSNIIRKENISADILANIVILEKLVQYEPNNVYVYDAISDAYVKLALLAYYQEDKKQLREYFRKAIEYKEKAIAIFQRDSEAEESQRNIDILGRTIKEYGAAIKYYEDCSSKYGVE
jgi:hypothetical protein